MNELKQEEQHEELINALNRVARALEETQDEAHEQTAILRTIQEHVTAGGTPYRS
jgi:hypothetical protein